LAYFFGYPVGFYISTIAFGLYLLARLGRALAERPGRALANRPPPLHAGAGT
jgi:hypothetical protein